MAAIDVGISEKEFMHMTLRSVRLRIERFWKREIEKQRQTEYYVWLTGYFNQFAIGAIMSKQIKYPSNPLLEREKSTDSIAKKTGKSEAELQQEERYFALRIKQANANIARAAKSQGE